MLKQLKSRFYEIPSTSFFKNKNNIHFQVMSNSKIFHWVEIMGKKYTYF